jgi:hypothetical protein
VIFVVMLIGFVGFLLDYGFSKLAALFNYAEV